MGIKFNKYICSDSKLEKAEIPATTPVDTIPAGTIPVATSIAEPPEVVATVFPVGGISVVLGENSPFPIHSKPQENEVEKWVRQDLAGSGIDLTDFREYGGKIIDTPEQFCELLGYVPNCTPYSPQGWAIPFVDPVNGKLFSGKDGLPFFRIRLRYPSGGKAKYLSRRNAGQHAFILPPVHEALCRNPTLPLVITEGEKKAWCAVKHGLPVIGLTGNFGWSLPGTHELLPELVHYLTAARPVIVIWDSDAKGNRHFGLSSKRLATALLGFGSSLQELILPSLSTDGKTGLDDFLIQRGRKEFEELLRGNATEIPPDRRAISSPINGSAGGRPATVKEIADTVARRWIDEQGRKTLAFYQGSFYQYEDGVYRKMPDSEAQALIMNSIRSVSPDHATKNMLSSVIQNLTSEDMFFLSERVHPPFNRVTGEKTELSIHLQNGFLLVERAIELIRNGESPEGAFYANSPDIFNTNKFPYEFNWEAECPRFNTFLQEVQPNAEEQAALLMLMGLSLIPDTSYNVIFFLYGEGGCGKSVFLETMRKLVGEENCCCVPLCNLQRHFNVIGLVTCLLNIVGDMPTEDGFSSHRVIEGMLKDIASGGTIHVEEKFKQGYDAPVTARCIFATNSLPFFADRSLAMGDRLRIIPFTQRFRGTNQEDPMLRERLVEELPGIFNVALKGLADLKKLKRFPDTKAGKQLKENHLNRCASERVFLHERVRQQEGSVCFTFDLYRAYSLYCRDSGIIPVGLENFKLELQRQYPHLTEKRIQVGDRRASGWRDLEFVSEVTEN